MAKPVVLPLTITLLLHVAIVLLLAFNLKFPHEPQVLPPQPQIIEARLVKLDAIPSAKPLPAPKPVEAPPKPVSEPQPKPETKPEPPKPELSKPEPVKPTPPVVPTPKPDDTKQKQLAKEKAEAAKKAAQQKQEAETKKQQEDQQRKQREQMEKSELAKAMAAEDQAVAAANSQEAVTSYMALIQRAIQNNWSRPPNARNGMHVLLSIQMIPTGEIVDVSVVKGSGDDLFDRSAVAAVKRTGQIPELKELSQKAIRDFEKNFRRFQLDFHPEDLRQ